MAEKPKHASDYESEQVELVRAMCLYVATKLGDMMDDLLIVGGLMPSLIIDHEHRGEDAEPHVGTNDLDVGLQVALLNEGRYRQLAERLRDAGFEMAKNDAGNPTRQRWAIANAERVTIDFLIQPTLEGDKGGKLRDLEPDFAAIIATGLRCAFRDRKKVTLDEVKPGQVRLGESVPARVAQPSGFASIRISGTMRAERIRPAESAANGLANGAECREQSRQRFSGVVRSGRAPMTAENSGVSKLVLKASGVTPSSRNRSRNASGVTPSSQNRF